MNIKLEIIAESADEFLAALRALSGSTATVALLKDAALGPITRMVTGSTFETVAAEEPKTEPAKRGRKASNVVDLQATKESVKEPEVETAGEPQEDPKADAKAADLAENLEEADEPAKTPELTVDLVRKFAVKYANDLAVEKKPKDDQEKQAFGRIAFQEMTKHFGVTKFTEIDAAKMGEVYEWLVAKRASAGLAALDIAALA